MFSTKYEVQTGTGYVGRWEKKSLGCSLLYFSSFLHCPQHCPHKAHGVLYSPRGAVIGLLLRNSHFHPSLPPSSRLSHTWQFPAPWRNKWRVTAFPTKLNFPFWCEEKKKPRALNSLHLLGCWLSENGTVLPRAGGDVVLCSALSCEASNHRIIILRLIFWPHSLD